jgi:hypothetical protein
LRRAVSLGAAGLLAVTGGSLCSAPVNFGETN